MHTGNAKITTLLQTIIYIKAANSSAMTRLFLS